MPSPFGSTSLEATPFEVKPLDGAPFEVTPFEATPFEPPAFEGTPFESPAFMPTGFEPEDTTTPPVAFDQAPDPLAPDFNGPVPATTEHLTGFGDSEATFPPSEPTGFDPLPPPPPAAEHRSFDPLPEAEHDPFAPLLSAGPTAFDPLPPPPPAAQHHRFDALPQVEAATTPALHIPGHSEPVPAMAAPTVPFETPADTFPPPPTPPAPMPPASAIRPPTPTRIPAGSPEGTRSTDAKAMLARIAALRTDKDD